MFPYVFISYPQAQFVKRIEKVEQRGSVSQSPAWETELIWWPVA